MTTLYRPYRRSRIGAAADDASIYQCAKNGNGAIMSDQISSFIANMRAHGIGPTEPDEIVADDIRRRYRVDGDKPHSRNGLYQLRVDGDGFAVGWAMSFKVGDLHSWHSRNARKSTPEQKAIWRKKQSDAKILRDAEVIKSAHAAAKKARRIWAMSAATGTTEYLDRKGCDLHGARVWNGLVVIPMFSDPGMVGLQFISGDGSKRFLTGSAKSGSYFPIISADENKTVIVICEGFATAAAIRTATGWPVVAAFDAENMKPVVVIMRKKYPDARIIIGADNDQWREGGNIGVDKARQAAVAIGGARVIFPAVPADDADRRTDWDDVFRSDGITVVRDAFMTEPEPDLVPDYDVPEDQPDLDDDLAMIRPLGHCDSVYSFFPRSKGQIVSLTATAMGRIQSLYMLAPRAFWERHYGGDKISDSTICAMASAHLIQACHEIGVFQEGSTRGVGAWNDGNRIVVNTGNRIVGPDINMHPAEFEGESVYESGPQVIHFGADPLRNREAVKLRELCGRLKWKQARFGDMLAGWIVVAPVGSALIWRPHVAIVGQSGSGKSTVMKEVVEPALGDIAIRREGGTTEAGVRKALGSSGRPYLLDEAESETPLQKLEMDKIVGLIRRASSGGVIENFNGRTQIRSCFFLAAINARIVQEADKSRISELELTPDTGIGAKARYDEWLADAQSTLTQEFSARLFARTISNIETLLANIDTFARAGSEIFGNRRQADQIAPMVAGAYLLTTTRRITSDAAHGWLAAQDWSWHTDKGDGGDAQKLMAIILTSRIRYDVGGIAREQTISDMIEDARGSDMSASDNAMHGLRGYGIRVSDYGDLMIANSSPRLRHLLRETVYTNWSRTLSDHPGAHNFDGKTVRFGPIVSKVTAIPLALIMEDIPLDEELSFKADDFR